MSIDKKAFGLSDSLVSAVNEALKGGQVKLDKNHNGKLDAQDFKMLRKEDAKPDYLDFDKDGNKKEPMKKALKDKNMKEASKEEEEAVDEQSPGDYEKANYNHKMMKEGNPANKAKKNAAAAAVGAQNRDAHHNAKRGMRTDVADKIRGREVMQGQSRVRHEETQVAEAAPAASGVADQMAAKKDALQSQIQRKIAQKQMDVMKAKANKRISSMKESGSKKSCGCMEDKKCKCSDTTDKNTKGGREAIVMNPPLKEASNLPKKVVTKGHEIAKSLIKHKSKVDNPYAVGMAAAKKSAGIKEDAEQVDEKKAYKPDKLTKARNPLVYGDKKKSNPLVYGDKHRDNPLVYGKKKVTKEEAEQVDEVLDSPIKKMAYIMKAKKSIEKSDPKKIKQANDVANRVIGIKRVMNKMNKKD